MALTCRKAALGQKVVGLVVRPRPSGGGSSGGSGSGGPESPNQALVFTVEGGVHELEGAGGGGGSSIKLGPRLAAAGSSKDDSLEASNRALELEEGEFAAVCSLAADGRGGVWVADCDLIRRLDTRCGEVTTLAGVEAPKQERWECLVCEPAAGTLWAATWTAVCRVRTEGSGGVELAAGDWEEEDRVDGSGTAVRFSWINALLPVSGGRLLIADGFDLRCMDAGGAVTTLLRDCFPSRGIAKMALLPSGELGAVTCDGNLVLVSGGAFAQPYTDLLLNLLAPPAVAEDADDSGGSSSAALPEIVTVRVGDRAFPVQRSVLAAGSEYFARLLAPGGGFAESGAAEVALPDADPAAFAHLLSYMYGTAMCQPCMHSLLRVTPPELQRPTAALAGRLLVGGGAVAALTERLAAAVTPASVLSDLAWADAHGMTELAERLRAFAVAHRKALNPSGMEELAMQSPLEAARLLAAFAQA
ncbi:hypothetical protein HYH03_008439 [Edaphochlamys debaryana]|uniref:BTB domain-containing protein n=1 Tax=Edaphochlamys debaryana TaxID=47281 RepID=A0A836BZD8_9CHLO|nr:hypothetical protein HYH03_008439 [Edaphochlamys debaryana]|eukprot:KAG2493303.1 hypothetical protein HYH03_008439 [Edaphochlamys debaryana]